MIRSMLWEKISSCVLFSLGRSFSEALDRRYVMSGKTVLGFPMWYLLGWYVFAPLPFMQGCQLHDNEPLVPYHNKRLEWFRIYS